MKPASRTRVIAFLAFLVVVGVVVSALLYLKGAPEEPAVQPAGQEAASPETIEALPTLPPPEAEERPSEKSALKPTDAQVREWAGSLSKNAEYLRWVAIKHLLGKFVAVVENISTGQSPAKLLSFMEPEGRFAVFEKKEKEFVDPKGYRRYDRLVGAFVSINTSRCARLLHKLDPWLNRKYRELGNPELDFRGALQKAMAEMLRVPIVEGDIPLQRISVNLKIGIAELEAMSDAQKHLFRMGPVNIRKVQDKLRELGRALDMSGELLKIEVISYSRE